MASERELPPGCTAVRAHDSRGWSGACPCGARFQRTEHEALIEDIIRHWQERHEPVGIRQPWQSFTTRERVSDFAELWVCSACHSTLIDGRCVNSGCWTSWVSHV